MYPVYVHKNTMLTITNKNIKECTEHSKLVKALVDTAV